jgi:Immunoglobulin-like domain of bacterial spore germination
MRQTRSFPTAVLNAGLVTVALLLGGCSAGGGGAAPGGATASPSPLAKPAEDSGAGGEPTSTTAVPTTTTTGGTAAPAPAPAGAKQAEATAAFFMRTEIGMRKPVTRPFRATGADTGEVGVYPGAGSESGGPLPNLVTTVSLRRRPGGWEVTGTRTRDIVVTQPSAGARIASPVRLAGSALAFEGNVQVRVRDNRNGPDQTLGEGFVTGGGDAPGAFRGQIAFKQPTAAAGWVILYEDSAATSGQVLQATMVRVRFNVPAPAPRLLTVTTSPSLRDIGGWLELPKGPGTVRFTVKADHAERVRFVLTPTGTGTAPYARLLGEDRDPRDGFTLNWSYGPGDAASAHLDIQAIGPGGKAGKELGIAHAA